MSEYDPPLSPVDGQPLHTHEHLSDEAWWWACQEPEKPADKLVLYDNRCRKCVLKSEVDLLISGDDWETWWHPEMGFTTRKRSWLIARSLYWLDQTEGIS